MIINLNIMLMKCKLTIISSFLISVKKNTLFINDTCTSYKTIILDMKTNKMMVGFRYDKVSKEFNDDTTKQSHRV